MFGSLSIYGYTTNRNLTAMGQFLFIGLIGIIAVSIINIFVQSSAIFFAVSVLSVIIFAGLTAYDTQNIKQMYLESGISTPHTQVVGALQLYLDFINLFTSLLHIFGIKND